MQLALEVGQTAQPEAIMFWILGPMAVAAALGMLLVKKAVHSAILMAFVMIVNRPVANAGGNKTV